MSTRSLNKVKGLAARKWLLVDATDVPLGRLASKVAAIIRGKNKVEFAPHLDVGDFVVVINAGKIKLTGSKADKKIYRHHTEFAGGVKEITAGKLREEDPAKMISLAVNGMLPAGPLGFAMRTKLKVYPGASHPHKAQKLESVSVL